MASPIKPRVKRAKPAPAILANPAVASAAPSTPFVSGTATFPPKPAPAPMVDAEALIAATEPVAAPMIADTAPIVAADAHETPTPPATDVAEQVETQTERTVETVAAQTRETVSALAEGPHVMATAFDTTKTHDMMGDMSSKAKGAMEKGVKFAEDMTEFTKGNVQAIVESGRVAAKGIEAMAHDATETAKSSFEQAQTAMKSFTQVKSPTELFQLQSDYAKTAFDQLVANASKASEQMMKFMGDVAQPLSNRVALASEKVKSAAF
ncbi:TIGR01841 family phasin [Sphingomonas arantia]|uniref:TIGR01841 family phasin n=1 Tax=Sphingomonas arantia TaxID=1460676 RepID=A0ABW4TSB6_9SPHN